VRKEVARSSSESKGGETDGNFRKISLKEHTENLKEWR